MKEGVLNEDPFLLCNLLFDELDGGVELRFLSDVWTRPGVRLGPPFGGVPKGFLTHPNSETLGVNPPLKAVESKTFLKEGVGEFLEGFFPGGELCCGHAPIQRRCSENIKKKDHAGAFIFCPASTHLTLVRSLTLITRRENHRPFGKRCCQWGGMYTTVNNCELSLSLARKVAPTPVCLDTGSLVTNNSPKNEGSVSIMGASSVDFTLTSVSGSLLLRNRNPSSRHFLHMGTAPRPSSLLRS